MEVILLLACIFCSCILFLIGGFTIYYLLNQSITSALHNKKWIDGKSNKKFKVQIDEKTNKLSVLSTDNVNIFTSPYTLIDANTLVIEDNREKITYVLENFMRIKVIEYNKNTKETATGYLTLSLL